MPRHATPFRAFVVLPRCLYIGKAWLAFFFINFLLVLFFYQLSFLCAVRHSKRSAALYAFFARFSSSFFADSL